MILVILCVQSVSCSADVPCTDCCLIPGNYDGVTYASYTINKPGIDTFYKDKGGLRQVQRVSICTRNCSDPIPWEDATAGYVFTAADSFDVSDVAAPVAVAAVDNEYPLEGMLVTFDGSGSTDDFGVTNYTWTFDDPYCRIMLLRAAAWAAGESPYRFDALVLRDARVTH